MLRLALIHGCPNAAAQYAEAARRLRGVVITAAVHADDKTRQEVRQALGVSVAAASWDELLASHAADFDAVLIRGSVSQRADLVCRAARAGKHVFVTTPAASSEREVDRMATICQSAGVTLLIGSRRRFQPSIAAVKSALDSGKLGSPALLRLHRWLPRETGRPDAWDKASKKDSGGVWSEIVTHLDLVLWMFGRSPTEIFVQGRGGPRGDHHWPDYLQLHLGFPDGGMALLSLAFGLPVGDEYDVLSVIGSTGAAYADDHSQRQLIIRGEASRAVKDSDDIPTRTAQLRAFAGAVAAADNSSDEVENMKAALRLTEAAWISLTERQPVLLAGGQHVAP